MNPRTFQRIFVSVVQFLSIILKRITVKWRKKCKSGRIKKIQLETVLKHFVKKYFISIKTRKFVKIVIMMAWLRSKSYFLESPIGDTK